MEILNKNCKYSNHTLNYKKLYYYIILHKLGSLREFLFKRHKLGYWCRWIVPYSQAEGVIPDNRQWNLSNFDGSKYLTI